MCSTITHSTKTRLSLHCFTSAMYFLVLLCFSFWRQPFVLKFSKNNRRRICVSSLISLYQTSLTTFMLTNIQRFIRPITYIARRTLPSLNLHRSLHSMASLTAFFPTVDAPNKGKKPAAATSSSSAPSPKKPTAAGRKRKADEDKDDEANGAATSSSSSSSADPDLSSPAKKQKGAAASSSSSDSSAISPDSLESMVPSSWRPHLQQEFAKAYWPKIDKFLQSQVDGKVKVFPPRHQIFRALELCPFEDLKVVILGQGKWNKHSKLT